MKHLGTILLTALGVAVGAAAIVYGEGDDSPGLQGIGVLVILGVVVLCVRAIRKRRRRSS